MQYQGTFTLESVVLLYCKHWIQMFFLFNSTVLSLACGHHPGGLKLPKHCSEPNHDTVLFGPVPLLAPFAPAIWFSPILKLGRLGVKDFLVTTIKIYLKSTRWHLIDHLSIELTNKRCSFCFGSIVKGNSFSNLAVVFLKLNQFNHLVVKLWCDGRVPWISMIDPGFSVKKVDFIS